MPKRPDIDLFLKRALSKCVMFEEAGRSFIIT